MEIQIFVILVTLVLLVGCTKKISLYPVDGPMSEQEPPPVLTAVVDGIMGNHGNIALTMPDGEACKGEWSSAAAGVTVGTASLIGTYGPTYGIATSMSTGTGQNPGQAMITCDQGRSFQVEFITGW